MCRFSLRLYILESRKCIMMVFLSGVPGAQQKMADRAQSSGPPDSRCPAMAPLSRQESALASADSNDPQHTLNISFEILYQNRGVLF